MKKQELLWHTKLHWSAIYGSDGMEEKAASMSGSLGIIIEFWDVWNTAYFNMKSLWWCISSAFKLQCRILTSTLASADHFWEMREVVFGWSTHHHHSRYFNQWRGHFGGQRRKHSPTIHLLTECVCDATQGFRWVGEDTGLPWETGWFGGALLPSLPSPGQGLQQSGFSPCLFLQTAVHHQESLELQ